MSTPDDAVNPAGSSPLVSVVVPAYNEAQVLHRCLTALADLSNAGLLEVVVVANGCTDDTAAVARLHAGRLSGLRVLERQQPGKIGALNAGDDASSAFPRVYLDADVVLDGEAMHGLIAVLSTPAPVVAAPQIKFDLDGASWGVRAFYRVFEQLPYVTDGLVGLGVYGVSAAGRSRFDRFPEVIADDLFVQENFAPAERLLSPGSFTVRVPRRLPDLIRVRSRGARGKEELDRLRITPHALATTSTSSRSVLLGVLRREPHRALDVFVYLGVTVAGRLRARRGEERWARDESSRAGDATDVSRPAIR